MSQRKWQFHVLSGKRLPCIFIIPVFMSFMAIQNLSAESQLKTILFKHAVIINGELIDLNLKKDQVLTVIFYSTQCPIANDYYEDLTKLHDKIPSDKIRFIGVCVDPDISREEVAEHAKEYALNFPVVHDKHGILIKSFQATITPEVFVLDHEGQVQYQGRIDNRFAQRQQRNGKPRINDLEDALTALAEGRQIAVRSTEPVGCPVPDPMPTKPDSGPTYSREISRIIQKKCQECHTKGQIGPFPLENYEHARKRASDLADVTASRSMPPWKAEPGFGRKLKHERSLSEAEIKAFADWADAGAPLGDVSEMPPPVYFANDWKNGTPDLILQISDTFEIPSSGPDVYRCFVLPTNLPEDVFVSAIEYKPDNRKVVHHITGYVDTTGEGRRRDQLEAGPGYTSYVGVGFNTHSDLSGWAAGRGPTVLPENVGYSLPAKSDIILQMHYHPSGKPEKDRSMIGLYFSKKPVKAALIRASAANNDFSVPANAKNHEIHAQWVAPVDVIAYGVAPHMHLVGKDMTMTVTYPDGREEKLIRVPQWDFNWQTSYDFEEPMELPKGTILKVVAHFDNSSENHFNPNNPPKELKWGPATTDEMCIGFIGITKKGQDLRRPGEKNDLNEIIHKSHRKNQNGTKPTTRED